MIESSGVLPPTMRAVMMDRYGGPEVLRLVDAPLPVPGIGQVLVRMTATSVNGGDLRMRSGEAALITGRRFPKGLGLDVVGTVAAVGPGVDRWDVGDRVWGVHPEAPRNAVAAPGAYAEYAVMRSEALGRVPTILTSVQAAALPVVGTTALFAVEDVAAVQPGESVLVRGASGGAGVAVTQVLTARGAEVTALVGSAGQGLTSTGATVLHHREHPLDSLPTFDVVIDTVGSQLLRLRRRAAHGRTVTITLSPVLRAGAELLISQAHGRHRVRFSRDVPGTAQMDRLARAVEAGEVRPVVQRVFSLDGIVEAHRDATSGAGTFGKRVVRISPDEPAG